MTQNIRVESTLDGSIALKIPNKEVRMVFQDSILEWFESYVVKIDRAEICNAIWQGDLEKAQKRLSALLLKSVSYYDYRESFFFMHFLPGCLREMNTRLKPTMNTVQEDRIS